MFMSSRLITVTCVAATLLLAGCHTIVDARWANADDTVDHWKKAMPSLPVEVHGALPGATNQQIAEAIPHAKAMDAIDSSDTSLAAPRLIVELGPRATPHDDAYCAKPAKAATAAGVQAQSSITLTICDGSRLVATSSKPFDPATTPVSALPKRLDSLKKLALIGIARTQTEEYQIQG